MFCLTDSLEENIIIIVHQEYRRYRKQRYSKERRMSKETDVLFVVLYSVFSGLVIVSNGTVIIVIIKSRELHLPTLWNIAFIAAWDLALGLHFLVFIVPSKSCCEFVYPDAFGVFATKLMMFIMVQNGLNIMIALVDRYISISWPLHYNRIMSPKRFTLTISSGVLVNLLRRCILFTTKDDGVYNKALGMFTASDINTRASVSGLFALIILSIVIVLLIKIRLELRRTRSNSGGQPSSSSQFTYTMYLSTIAFIVCYIPSAIYAFVALITGKSSDVMMQVGMTCILSNSLWNVFIYGATYRPFRDAFLKLFCPTFFRERARRELQVHFHNNRVSVFTVED